MCAVSAVVTGMTLLSSIYGTISNAQVQSATAGQLAENAKYSSAINQRNAELAQINANDALIQGQNEQERIRRESQNNVANLATRYAAGNIALGSGSPLDVLSGYTELGELDALGAGAEANRIAQNYLIQAGDLNNQAIIDIQNADFLNDKIQLEMNGDLLDGTKDAVVYGDKFATALESLTKKGPNYL